MATSSANPTFKYLNTRWDVRAARLPVEAGRGLVVLPEAVTLAEFLWNLEWRRHVAMAERNFELGRFYQHVGRRLGQPDDFAHTIAWGPHRPTQEMGHRAPQTAHTDPGRILEPGS
jgi:hypothetical protein